MDYFYIGLFIGSFTIVGGIVATQAGRIEHRLGEKKSLLFILIAIIGSFGMVFLMKSAWAIVIQYLIYGISFLVSPITNGYINQRVDSEHRSTVVSIATLLFTVVLAPIEIGFGFVATEWGTRESLLILALVAAPVGLFLLSIWFKEVDLSKQKTKKIRSLKQF